MGWITTIVNADKFLAQVAIDATAAHGNAKKLADAGTQMTAAAQSVAAQQYGAAIGGYEAAWQDAEAA